ncbi:MAG TPA: hypothetical protein VGS21_04870 [Acidimicrobiales bacterium]|nr:hypothetical protein [Acidimicrobiales bacterium]
MTTPGDAWGSGKLEPLAPDLPEHGGRPALLVAVLVPGLVALGVIVWYATGGNANYVVAALLLVGALVGSGAFVVAHRQAPPYLRRNRSTGALEDIRERLEPPRDGVGG